MTSIQNRFYYCIYLFLFTSLCTQRLFSQDTLSTEETDIRSSVTVIGMFHEIKNKEWDDERVGLGLRVILSQLIYDSGKFKLLEEKQEIIQKLDEIAVRIWALGGKDYDLKPDIDTLRTFGSDYVVYGNVIHFGRPKSRMSVGPVHSRRFAVDIKVQVTLLNLETNDFIRKEGKGTSATIANSLAFEYRDEGVELDKTNVGNATKAALKDAVDKVIREYENKMKNN